MNYKVIDKYPFTYLLTMLGGFIGGYSYVTRGGVFASAQTGNLIQLSLKMAEGRFDVWYLHILPMIMFGLGIMLCEYIKIHVGTDKGIHWMQMLLIMEACMLVIVAFMPIGRLNIYANMLLGCMAGMQTQCIRKVEGTVLMTTMLTGNARTLAENLFYAIHDRDGVKGKVAWKLFGTIIFFIVGVMMGAIFSTRYHQRAIIFGLAFIVIAQAMIIMNRKTLLSKFEEA